MKKDGLETLRFDGRVAFKDGDVSRYSVAASFQENDFTNLELEIFWHGEQAERRKGLGSFMNHRMNHIWIRNDDSRGHIELLGLNGYSTQFSGASPISTIPTFSTLQFGILPEVEPKDRRLYVTVRLTPSGLIEKGIHEQHYTGEIKISPWADRKPIEVQTRHGILLADETYNFEDSVEFGAKVTKRIPQTTLSGEINVPHGSSLQEVHEHLLQDLEAVRVALGLCFRQPVRIVHFVYRDLDDRQRAPAFSRRKLAEQRQKVEQETFIHPRNLGGGGLQRLAEGIRGSSDSADLLRAISFLAASYENNLESAFFMAFSAMETMVNIATSGARDLGYSKADWSAIRRSTEETLRRVAVEVGVDPTDLVEKLPELRRPSFRRRLAAACNALQPATADLWSNRDFFEGMSEAAGIRNGLFHAAEYTDPNGLSDSLLRVRTFTERLLAKYLKWPDEELWPHRDSDLAFQNRHETKGAAPETGQ